VWRVWNRTYTVFPETAWFFGIRTDLISVLFSCIVWHAFTWRAYIYHDITCHLLDITLLPYYHLTSDMIYLTLIIITIMGMMTWYLAYILIYFSTNHTPDTPVFLIFLACSYSFLKSDNYLINHKIGQLTSHRENLRISIHVCVYIGIRYVVQLKLSIWPEDLQATEGSVGSLLPGAILKRASYKTLM